MCMMMQYYDKLRIWGLRRREAVIVLECKVRDGCEVPVADYLSVPFLLSSVREGLYCVPVIVYIYLMCLSTYSVRTHYFVSSQVRAEIVIHQQ